MIVIFDKSVTKAGKYFLGLGDGGKYTSFFLSPSDANELAKWLKKEGF